MIRKRERLRTGYTTGACSAAAARAATLGLITGEIPSHVATLLPNGTEVTFPVEREGAARASVIKDAGDDPDVTHGARLTASARALPDLPGQIRLLGGEGVGRVTRLGVGLPVGEAAINPVPCANIIANVQAAAGDWLQGDGLEITLSVPGGAEMAKRTLNPRLGIVGGISILGTSGIVYPYSTAAFKAALRQSIAAAAMLKEPRILLTTGRRTERFAMAVYPDLPEQAVIQMGDFIGAGLTAVAQGPFRHLILGVMPGKLAKIAQGLANTHAGKGSVAMDAVAEAVRAAGGDESMIRQARSGPTVRHAAELLQDAQRQEAFGRELLAKAMPQVRARLPDAMRVTILLFDFEGRLLASQESGP
ncbi:MAG: cobalt-precorrin-5B (C(1))-methyltransferase [Magnetococcales bacterium]|nr:cobalt-precorrin-5B (C(1))-methyltransferase [Magnetococcales bacterium]